MPIFELQLAAEPPKLAEYQAYIDFELKEGDPARIQIILERTLAENCLVPDMWAKYTTYLVSIYTLRVEMLTLDVSILI